ncbi:MAG: DUF167 domain-containing protein [Planctomycetes bacterium]|nr:DUF167 domain-containing protein [Planctomycetota bacterium]
MIPVTGNARGASFRVHAAAGSTREGIQGVHGEALKVAVRVAPERGRANRALCALLAAELGVARRDVRVVVGEAARDKTVEVAGLGAEELVSRLRGLLARARGTGRGRETG